MKRNFVRTAWLMLPMLFLNPACSDDPISESGSRLSAETSLASPLAAQQLMVAPGKSGPSVCALQADGHVECYGLASTDSTYAAMRIGAPYVQIDQDCGVTRKNDLVCWNKPSRGLAPVFPTDHEILKPTQIDVDDYFCGVGQQSGRAVSFCLRGQEKHVWIADHGESWVDIKTKGSVVCSVTASGGYGCTDLAQSRGSGGGSMYPPRYLAKNNSSMCVVYDDASFTCMDIATFDRSPIPADIRQDKLLKLVGGGNEMCAIYKDGDLQCWGAKRLNRSNFGIVTQKVVQVGASDAGVCAQAEDGRVVCLDATFNNISSFNKPKASLLTAGRNRTCAMESSKSFCWGENADLNIPQDIGYNSGKEIALGAQHACYAGNTGVVCSGSNDQQQIAVPPEAARNYAFAVATHENASCSIDLDGRVTCWGPVAAHQRAVPTGMGFAVDIGVGTNHACVINEQKKVICWGDNSKGQARAPQDLGPATKLALAADHSCALLDNGELSCWGDNAYGQTSVQAGQKFKDVSTGLHDTCAVTSQDTVSCWGAGEHGQRSIPRGLGRVLKVAVGDAHVCAVRADSSSQGRIQCWGAQGPSDIETRLEKSSDPHRLSYDNALFRMVKEGTNLVSCRDGSCNLSSAPFLAFRGLNVTQDEERYELHLRYSTNCSLHPHESIQVEVNGNQKLHAKVQNGNEFRIGGSQTDQNNGNGLSGPVILRLRKTMHGNESSTIAPCEFKIENMAVLPLTSTLKGWSTTANELALNLPADFNNWLSSKYILFLLGSNFEGMTSKLTVKYAAMREAMDRMLTRTQMLIVIEERDPIEDLPAHASLAMSQLFKGTKVLAYNASGAMKEVDAFTPVEPRPKWLTELKDDPSNVDDASKYEDAFLDYNFFRDSLNKTPGKDRIEFADIEANSRIKLESGLARASSLLEISRILRERIAAYYGPNKQMENDLKTLSQTIATKTETTKQRMITALQP